MSSSTIFITSIPARGPKARAPTLRPITARSHFTTLAIEGSGKWRRPSTIRGSHACRRLCIERLFSLGSPEQSRLQRLLGRSPTRPPSLEYLPRRCHCHDYVGGV